MRALITGGAGFIGSALILRLIADGHDVLNLDKLTYAGDLRNLASVESHPRYCFARIDITNEHAVSTAARDFGPDTIFHLAAESHVDRSIDEPGDFIKTNLVGTYVMLETALKQSRLGHGLRFLHVSTDEVYGSLGPTGLFEETTPYAPNSPYSASKAGADHLVRAWTMSYGLEAFISNCSNNYGPRQNAEKLIPTIIRNALLDRPIPIYGDGRNIRDWLYVDDHIDAMLAILERGRPGEKYNIGGHNEVRNIEIARLLCSLLDSRRPRQDGACYADQIAFVTDRPGHDLRYAIDPTKATRELRWRPSRTFESGLAETVEWYLADDARWLPRMGEGERLGLSRGQLP